MQDLDTVAPAFVEMEHRIVWCSAASVDEQGRPRSRILHPIWQWQDGPVSAVMLDDAEALLSGPEAMALEGTVDGTGRDDDASHGQLVADVLRPPRGLGQGFGHDPLTGRAPMALNPWISEVSTPLRHSSH